eukprot:9513283-Alexandrium_andersonii.AAC.1
MTLSAARGLQALRSSVLTRMPLARIFHTVLAVGGSSQAARLRTSAPRKAVRALRPVTSS